MDTPNKADSKEIIRVSVSEAARLFGVNSQTIRRAITAKEVTYVVVGGRYKLNFESLVKWSQRHSTLKNKLAKKGIGQYVDKWKIKNTLYSPNPKAVGTPPPTVTPISSSLSGVSDPNDTSTLNPEPNLQTTSV